MDIKRWVSCPAISSLQLSELTVHVQYITQVQREAAKMRKDLQTSEEEESNNSTTLSTTDTTADSTTGPGT